MDKILGLLAIISFAVSSLTAQSWSQKNENDLTLSGIQDFNPTKSIIAQVSDNEIKEILWNSPYENQSRAADSPARLKLMLADGSSKSFGIVRYDMQGTELTAKFDDIRTFKGVCLSDSRIRVRLDYTVHGLRAWINNRGSHSYIEHYKRGNRDYKIVYDRKDLPKLYDFECSATEQKINGFRNSPIANSRQGTCEFNTLRLANATTGEYSDYHTTDDAIPDEEEVHSAVVTAINRVNEVYEQDFGVRMVLIDNNDEIYYYDGSSDPYTNGSGGAMLGENQDNLDDVIGNDNYDIGHVFSTGGGGVAYLSSVCNNSTKAGGVTGQAAPVGDPFSIDYVAHEMGHQMGANHTQNNGCNRNNSTAMEPGSASTIMGYAGICSPNVQNNSDPYFHAISVEEVMNDASVFSCAEEIVDFGNTSPEVTLESASYTIPASTTFVLDAEGSDPDGDDITYCWEQMDNQVATMPPASTNTSGPAFRSLEPVADSKRYFPSLPDIIAGNSPTWEVIPSVSRDLDFRITVRDWHDGPGTSDAGCTAEADVTVIVDGGSGPFVVTSPSSNVTWNSDETETVTWDVAGTDSAPVSCSNVEIWFSEDDSFDAPTLVATTANDGSADIIVPSILTTTGKIMIKGEDNIFFDINEGDITIEQSIPTFNMSLTYLSFNICNDETSITNRLNVSSVLGYDEEVSLSIVSGLPAGANVSFTNNPLDPGEFTFFDISNFGSESGIFDIVVEGVSGTISKTVNFEFILSDDPVAPEAISPPDGNESASAQPLLIWEDVVANSFDYELSNGPNGTGLLQSGNVTDNQVAAAVTLDQSTTYYWRVKTNNECGSSDWSDNFSFTTLSCQTYSSEDVPITIAADVTNTITSELNIYDRGDVDDINIVDLVGTHTWLEDLNFSLIASDGTEMEFWDQPCGSQNDFDINFDDEAADDDFPCPPTDGGTYQPTNSMTVFDTKPIQGEWSLEIFDDFAQDGGELQSWGLEVCISDFCDLTVSNTNVLGLGSFLGALNCAIEGDTIRLMPDISGQTINLTNIITLNNNVNILADPTDNITLSFNNTDGGLIIADDVNVSIEGFTIAAGGTLPAITNNGALKLTNTDIVHSTGNQVINSETGIIEVIGICNIQE